MRDQEGALKRFRAAFLSRAWCRRDAGPEPIRAALRPRTRSGRDRAPVRSGRHGAAGRRVAHDDLEPPSGRWPGPCGRSSIRTIPTFGSGSTCPREPFLLDEGVVGALPADLEALLRADPRFEVRFTPNLGPYRKILPVLAELYERRALVATADDDTVYPRDWLGGLVAAYRRHGCVVCYRGHRMLRRDRVFQDYRDWMHAGIVRQSRPA